MSDSSSRFCTNCNKTTAHLENRCRRCGIKNFIEVTDGVKEVVKHGYTVLSWDEEGETEIRDAQGNTIVKAPHAVAFARFAGYLLNLGGQNGGE